MNEYEKYQLQWMLDHNHSIREMITRLGEIAFNEMSNDVGLSFDKIMDEAFEIFEYEQGFKNEEIWLCKDEWEHDLYSSNEYSLTDAGKTKVKHFIEECRIKQDSILKAGLDTAKDKAIFLKNEYGIGGQTYDFKNKKQDKGYIDHDSKGLAVFVSSKDSASLFKDSESKTFSWADVSSRIERLIATGKYFTDEEMEHYNSMNKDEILPAWLLEKCGLSDYTKNSQAVARPDWMEEYEILIDRDNDYVLLRDPDENVNQVWTASGKFLSTVQLENETVVEAMEEYYYNITKGGFYIPDRIKEGYMEEDYDNLSKEDIEL